jgi:hypothetical protein
MLENCNRNLPKLLSTFPPHQILHEALLVLCQIVSLESKYEYGTKLWDAPAIWWTSAWTYSSLQASYFLDAAVRLLLCVDMPCYEF